MHCFAIIVRLGADSSQPELPVWKFALVWYFGATAIFLLQQLQWWQIYEDKTLSDERRGLLCAGGGLLICALGSVSEFWLKPAFEAYYATIFRGADNLPLLSSLIFDVIPSGIMTFAAVLLCGISIWQTGGRRNHERRQLWRRLPCFGLAVLGFFFLVVFPLALFAPMF